MLLERSEITVREGTEDSFTTAMRDRGVPLLENVEGVLSVRFGRGVEAPSKYILLVGWTSMDAHKAYNQTDACQELRQLIGASATGATMEHFDLA